MNDEMNDDGYQDYLQLKEKKMRYQPKPEVIALTQKSKYMYPLFNLFELEVNRFHNLPQFTKLEHEIVSFNEELEEWKKKDKEPKNIFLTYHLYQNLFSRMKYTSNLVLDRDQAKRAYIQITKWFSEHKPKVRNKVPDKQPGKLKPSTASRQTEDQIDSLLVSNATKRQLKAYEFMARTSHTQFFPPKERLLEYKRRDLMEGISHTQRRASSVSNLSNGIPRHKNSLATTRTTFFKTATQGLTTKQTNKLEPTQPEIIIPPFQLPQEKQSIKESEELIEVGEPMAIDEVNKQKQVQQEQMVQQNIVQVVHEEDQPEAEEEVYSEQEEKEDKRYRKYRVDPSADSQMRAEENIKDAKQSTLRRILKEKEATVRRKMEELNLAQQMGNWGVIKSRQASEEHRKLQRMMLANKYRQLQYIPKTLGERQIARKKEIPEFQTFYRSKSSRPNTGTIQEQFERLKIHNALKTYGKYIKHVEIAPVHVETQEEKQQLRIMRATSLTSFCRQGKKAPFSSIVDKYGVESHNEDALHHVNKIKQKLAKTSISVEKRDILMALAATDAKILELPDSKLVYPIQKKLLSNPFFPKQAKSKKKKK